MPLPPVLFEDECLIAFDKPSGLPVSTDRKNHDRENLTGLVREKMGEGIATAHRVEEEVSGLVLYAKTKPALDFISGQFQSKTVIKFHHALVIGLPAEDDYIVDFFLKEDEGKPGTVCVVKKHGWACETAFTVVAKFPRQPAGPVSRGSNAAHRPDACIRFGFTWRRRARRCSMIPFMVTARSCSFPI